jgi:hypothetical protein
VYSSLKQQVCSFPSVLSQRAVTDTDSPQCHTTAARGASRWPPSRSPCASSSRASRLETAPMLAPGGGGSPPPRPKEDARLAAASQSPMFLEQNAQLSSWCSSPCPRATIQKLSAIHGGACQEVERVVPLSTTTPPAGGGPRRSCQRELNPSWG